MRRWKHKDAAVHTAAEWKMEEGVKWGIIGKSNWFFGDQDVR